MQAHRQQGGFLLHAFVLMPDHIHLILTPAPDISLEKAMQYIKGGFAFQLRSKLGTWEKSFEEHRIKDPEDYRNHLAYIEQNPVAAHLANHPEQYPYSSASQPQTVDACPVHLRATQG